jgi:hypothetical protein
LSTLGELEALERVLGKQPEPDREIKRPLNRDVPRFTLPGPDRGLLGDETKKIMGPALRAFPVAEFGSELAV